MRKFAFWAVPIAAALGFVMGYYPAFRFYALLTFLGLWPTSFVFTSERISNALGRELER